MGAGRALIPPRRPAIHARTGRPRASDRDVLEDIAFVLITGIGWAGQAGYRSASPSPAPTATTACSRLQRHGDEVDAGGDVSEDVQDAQVIRYVHLLRGRLRTGPDRTPVIRHPNRARLSD